jgi:hypothetical protein
MGVTGFKRWLEKHDVKHTSKASTDEMHHLLLDMNGLCHTAYDRTDPTAQGTKTRLFTMLDKIYNKFPPSVSISIIFDGPAPVAKLATQRQRRRNYADVDQGRDGSLAECQLTTGSAFMFEMEEEVEAHLVRRLQAATLTATEVFFSGTRVPGEGETKITRRLLDLASRPAFSGNSDGASAPRSPADANGAKRPYNVNDAICIVGNDSDLILNGVAATAYHNIYVVHPLSFVMTSVGDLILRWTQGTNHKLSMAQLPSARLDFVFLTLLAGCDHYEGIEDDAWSAWHHYRGLRCKPHRATARLVEPVDADPKDPAKGRRLRINTGFLREVVCPPSGGNGGSGNGGGSSSRKKQSGGTAYQQARRAFEQQQKSIKKGNPQLGAALCSASLWSMVSSIVGECPNYSYRWAGAAANVHALRKAVTSLNMSNIDVPVAADSGPMLRPLETYVAIMAKPKYLPAAVRGLLERDETVSRLTTYDSIDSVLRVTREIFEKIPAGSLTPTEQRLLAFGLPRLHVRDPRGKVTSTDPYVDTLTVRGSFLFAEFTYSVEQLVQGVHFNVPYTASHMVLKVSKTLAAKLLGKDVTTDGADDEGGNAEAAASSSSAASASAEADASESESEEPLQVTQVADDA